MIESFGVFSNWLSMWRNLREHYIVPILLSAIDTTYIHILSRLRLRHTYRVTINAGSVTVSGPTRTWPCSMNVTASLRFSAIFSRTMTTGRRRLRIREPSINVFCCCCCCLNDRSNERRMSLSYRQNADADSFSTAASDLRCGMMPML